MLLDIHCINATFALPTFRIGFLVLSRLVCFALLELITKKMGGYKGREKCG